MCTHAYLQAVVLLSLVEAAMLLNLPRFFVDVCAFAKQFCIYACMLMCLHKYAY